MFFNPGFPDNLPKLNPVWEYKIPMIENSFQRICIRTGNTIFQQGILSTPSLPFRPTPSIPPVPTYSLPPFPTHHLSHPTSLYTLHPPFPFQPTQFLPFLTYTLNHSHSFPTPSLSHPPSLFSTHSLFMPSLPFQPTPSPSLLSLSNGLSLPTTLPFQPPPSLHPPSLFNLLPL